MLSSVGEDGAGSWPLLQLSSFPNPLLGRSKNAMDEDDKSEGGLTMEEKRAKARETCRNVHGT